jgi:hypothetical protein
MSPSFVAVAAASEPDAAPVLHTVSFSVQARAEPGVMPRVVELFAKRGLVPQRWHSSVLRSVLSIEVQMSGLDRDLADYIARCMRQVIGVETVLTSETTSGSTA